MYMHRGRARDAPQARRSELRVEPLGDLVRAGGARRLPALFTPT